VNGLCVPEVLGPMRREGLSRWANSGQPRAAMAVWAGAWRNHQRPWGLRRSRRMQSRSAWLIPRSVPAGRRYSPAVRFGLPMALAQGNCCALEMTVGRHHGTGENLLSTLLMLGFHFLALPFDGPHRILNNWLGQKVKELGDGLQKSESLVRAAGLR